MEQLRNGEGEWMEGSRSAHEMCDLEGGRLRRLAPRQPPPATSSDLNHIHLS
jgi:hypothetical protein